MYAKDIVLTIAMVVHFFLKDQFLALSGSFSQSTSKFPRASSILSLGMSTSSISAT